MLRNIPRFPTTAGRLPDSSDYGFFLYFWGNETEREDVKSTGMFPQRTESFLAPCPEMGSLEAEEMRSVKRA